MASHQHGRAIKSLPILTSCFLQLPRLCLFIFIHLGMWSTSWATVVLKIQTLNLKIHLTSSLPTLPLTPPSSRVSAVGDGNKGNRANVRTLKGQTSWYPCSRAELQRAWPATSPPPCHTRRATDAMVSSKLQKKGCLSSFTMCQLELERNANALRWGRRYCYLLA